MSPLLLLLLLPPAFPLPLRITTKQGPVRGGWRPTTSGARLASFQGIPFAAPPVGDLRCHSAPSLTPSVMLRFASPEPAIPWQEELDVSSDSAIKCSQYGYMADGAAPGVGGALSRSPRPSRCLAPRTVSTSTCTFLRLRSLATSWP